MEVSSYELKSPIFKEAEFSNTTDMGVREQKRCTHICDRLQAMRLRNAVITFSTNVFDICFVQYIGIF